MSFKTSLTPRNQIKFDTTPTQPLQFDLTQSYFMTGLQGSGKTFAAVHFGKQSEEQGARPYLINFIDLIKIARKAAISGDEGWIARRELAEVKESTLLILDDLGVEKQTDFITESVYDLINYRYEHMLQTVITSNFSLDQISEKYHARIASRIAEMCEIWMADTQQDKRMEKFL